MQSILIWENIKMFLRLRSLGAPVGQFVINKGRQQLGNKKQRINRIAGGGTAVGVSALSFFTNY